MNQHFLKTLSFAMILSLSQSMGQAADLQTTRSLIDQWVETRQITSKEKSDWQVEQRILEDTRALLESELTRLSEMITTMEGSVTAAEEERASLTEAREALAAGSDALQSRIGGLENQLRGIVDFLPEPLVNRIKPLIRRLPEDPETTSLSLGERVQNIVGILSQADQFNTTLTQTSESRELADGKTVEVRTLYWGLATAFYVDTAGGSAGIGNPAPGGWNWQPKPEAAAQIRRLIDVYEGSAAIQFVVVPVRLID